MDTFVVVVVVVVVVARFDARGRLGREANYLLLHTNIFTARAMLSRYMPWPCVCLSVCLCLCLCLSQVGVLLKWLNVGTRKQRHTIAQGL